MIPFHKIEVDDKVWDFLKKNAEPFEDTPNSVLHRLLFGKDKTLKCPPFETEADSHRPVFPPGMPKALTQTLEMLYEVRKHGRSRNDATNLIANREGVAPQTIIDKYCRQLGKRAFEIDTMLGESTLTNLGSILGGKFPANRDFVDKFLRDLAK